MCIRDSFKAQVCQRKFYILVNIQLVDQVKALEYESEFALTHMGCLLYTSGDDGMNYDYTVCDPVAFTLAQDMPEEIESATCVLPSQSYHRCV